MPEVTVNPIDGGASISGSLGSIGASTGIEAKVGVSTLDGRHGVYIKNTSSVVLYWGFSSATCVCPLAAESSAGKGDGGDIWIDVGAHQQVFIKAASGTTNTAAVSELK